MEKIKKIILLLSVITSPVLAQKDTLTPMYINYGIREHLAKKQNTTTITAKVTSITPDTLEIPFREDFSKPGPYPDPAKWINSNTVFVNYNFGLNPITLGVATFDGLDKNGYPWDVAHSTSTSGVSDTLLSKPIHLDSTINGIPYVRPLDSVYLSFYYECKGLGGDAPESNDVLMLDFYDPSTGSWPAVGAYTYSFSRPTGITKYDTKFTRVMIPIKDPKYFSTHNHNCFQFRFRNKSSRCGSVDLWHIDNIYLNMNRSYKDTILKDVAITNSPVTLLKEYSAIPFKQYPGASIVDTSAKYNILNNNYDTINVTGFTRIYDNTGGLIYNKALNSFNIYPSAFSGYYNMNCIDSVNAASMPLFPFNSGNAMTDSMSFLVEHYIKTFDPAYYKTDDTIRYRQVFNNYFSYDDGTAEAGYQIESNSAYQSEVAVRYDMLAQDTLQAIDICFNPIIGHACNTGTISPAAVLNLSFGLRVWNDNGGHPGNILYRDTLLFPVYTSNINYPFFRFKLKMPLLMGPATTGPAVPYYFGIKQDDCNSINFGFDRNTNSQYKIFYNLDDGTGWQNSSFQGSVMIRPIFGDSIRAIDAIHEQPKITPDFSSLLLYPNPANDECYFSVEKENDTKLYTVTFYNTVGNLILSQDVHSKEAIATTQLDNGFYIVRISQNNKVVATRKIIISR